MKLQAFKPAWWFQNRHLQTIWGSFFRAQIKVSAEIVKVPLSDGAELTCELLWPHWDVNKTALNEDGILLILMHGLTGSAESHYIKGIQKAVAESDLKVVTLAINHRGALGHACPAKHTSRLYHAGIVDDISDTVTYVRRNWKKCRIFAFGASLSGNMLIRALGVDALPEVDKSMAVSVPFDLAKVADNVDKGFSKIYRNYLAKKMKEIINLKKQYIKNMPGVHFSNNLRTFWALDNFVVAPLHNFRNVHHYYRDSSSTFYINKVTQPLLVIQSKDDPLVPMDAWPDLSSLPPNIDFEASENGGHVGFIDQNGFWLERRVLIWLKNSL